MPRNAIKTDKSLEEEVNYCSVRFLETKTRAYWILSTDAKGLGNKIGAGDAIDFCRELMKVLGPARRLRNAVYNLSDNVIRGTSKKQKKRNNVIQFPSRQVLSQG